MFQFLCTIRNREHQFPAGDGDADAEPGGRRVWQRECLCVNDFLPDVYALCGGYRNHKAGDRFQAVDAWDGGVPAFGGVDSFRAGISGWAADFFVMLNIRGVNYGEG